MPWNDQSGGGSSGSGGDGKGGPSEGPNGGPWGGGPRRPWGQPPRGPQGGQGPDLEDLLRQWRERLRMGGGGGGGGGGAGGGRRGPSWRVVAGVLLGGWLLSGAFTVNETQQAVITRFGAYDRTMGAGIHWHLPFPVEARQVVNVTSQLFDEIGCRAQGERCEDNADESLMITGDRNIVQVHFRVSYRVSNARNFLFNVRDPAAENNRPSAVRQIAESAMRQVIGRRNLEPVITGELGAVGQDVEQIIQQTLDEYEAGVQVIRVEILNSSVPPEVIEAFNDVVRARSDSEKAVNDANRETAQILNAAQAYKEQIVREATGEAQRFTSVYDEYRLAPQVTRDRLYLETMERVYRTGNLVILDQRGGAVPYLPLDNYLRRPAPASQPQQQPQQGGR